MEMIESNHLNYGIKHVQKSSVFMFVKQILK